MDIELSIRESRSLYKILKRLVDIVGTLLLTLAFSPILLLISLVLRLTSRESVIFRQARIGRDGRQFWIYKFRTMEDLSHEKLHYLLIHDAQSKLDFDKFQKLASDPRLTPIGRFLRRFSLDELPQLWNILKGDMSLVGPRPCLPEQCELYGTHFAAYCQVRPGLTGLWQVSGRSLLSFKQRAILDDVYVTSMSLEMDFQILIRTIGVVIRQDGAY